MLTTKLLERLWNNMLNTYTGRKLLAQEFERVEKEDGDLTHCKENSWLISYFYWSTYTRSHHGECHKPPLATDKHLFRERKAITALVESPMDMSAKYPVLCSFHCPTGVSGLARDLVFGGNISLGRGEMWNGVQIFE